MVALVSSAVVLVAAVIQFVHRQARGGRWFYAPEGPLGYAVLCAGTVAVLVMSALFLAGGRVSVDVFMAVVAGSFAVDAMHASWRRERDFRRRGAFA